MWLSFTSPSPRANGARGGGGRGIFHPQGLRPVLCYVALSGLYPCDMLCRPFRAILHFQQRLGIADGGFGDVATAEHLGNLVDAL